MRNGLLFTLLLLSNLLIGQNLDVQGHRGARGLEPENTISAFMTALEEGVNTLELDVVITKDKQVVVSHEPYMSHVICEKPNGESISRAEAQDLNIYKMTYVEVAKYDCGSKGNPRFPDQNKHSTAKPLLSDVISQVESYIKEHNLSPVSYNIELKSSPKKDEIYHPGVPEFSQLVYDLLDEKLSPDRYTIQCFDFRVLQYWHKEYPNTRLVALIENIKSVDKNLESLGFVPYAYSPNYRLLNKSKVKQCHEKGMLVVPWTVNTRKEMEKLVEMGVDGIITDYPNLAKDLN